MNTTSTFSPSFLNYCKSVQRSEARANIHLLKNRHGIIMKNCLTKSPSNPSRWLGIPHMDDDCLQSTFNVPYTHQLLYGCQPSFGIGIFRACVFQAEVQDQESQSSESILAHEVPNSFQTLLKLIWQMWINRKWTSVEERDSFYTYLSID